MAGFVKVCTTGDVPIGNMKPFTVGYDRLIIAHTGSGFYAVVDECSHDSAPISDGKLCNHEVVCARHGARFDVRTGAVTAPPALVPIDKLELKVEGDDILVLLDD